MRLRMNQGERHTIFGKVVTGGDEFEVPDEEGKTWILIGKAQKADDPKPRRGKYSRADMRAESRADMHAENRADLRSEDEE